jgi:glycosyltransferase involved in cell wall biosynthesis
MPDTPFLSVVIPVYNEQENIAELLRRVNGALAKFDRLFEVIICDDGSTDTTPELLSNATSTYLWLRILRMARNSGQSAAFDAGFKAARGDVIATLDGDLQNDPEEIPRLVHMLNDGEGYDMITGWRKDRHDTNFRRWQTRMANRIRNWLSDETINDSACSLKIYRRHCLQGLQLYTGMHRFFPTLIKMRGFRVLEVPVKHSQRFAGVPKYGFRNRAFRAFIDLLAVRWMKKRYLRYEVREVTSQQHADDRSSGERSDRSADHGHQSEAGQIGAAAGGERADAAHLNADRSEIGEPA